ncbi:hypothetical protein ACJIZ3_010154 [Penstemon smallii]|uniref:Uncharacterized protein n=1 Tax=Penstemon smallii TaxID=265156 RepID=A0ABD3TFX0_9LAMI
MYRRKLPRSRAVQSPSTEILQFKLSKLISRHEQLKISFNQLNSQIRTGLLEAEDVFASLAIPLMQLVGLKTVQMASEGRFNTILTSVGHSHSQEEDFVDRALTAGNELIERQKLQLMQLIKLLRNIEAQVNSSQNNIFERLANHQNYIRKFFLKAFTYVSEIHQSSPRNDISLMMLKLLKATFDQVGDALGSVEVGVDDLTRELADKMCNPMVEYVNSLKTEMKAGTCSRLLEVVKEMDGAIKVRKFELEETRRKAMLAEQSKMESLSKLREAEETTRKLTISLGVLTGDSIESEETSTQQQVSIVKEDKAKDDNLLWELLRKKRNRQVPDSPIGPKGLLGVGTSDKRLSVTRVTPSLDHNHVTKSQSKGLQPQSSFMKSRMVLGSSPSATIQKVYSRRRITP